MVSFSRNAGPVLLAPPPPPITAAPLSSHHAQQQMPPHLVLAQQCAVEVRDVWAINLEEELATIHGLLSRYPCVCIDTEFPGAVHGAATPRHLRTAAESYAVVKRNVDELRLLQLGVALSGPYGRCPVVWQFNFRGFDAGRDPHAPASIAMLTAHGMDFLMLHEFGIDPDAFANGFFRSGLACRRLTWAAFSGAYDFAYLAKVLAGGRALPETLDGFLAQVVQIFGPTVLDIKYIARFCGGGGGIRGGLEQVAAALGVERAAGRAHNAGSDSLLTCDVLLAMASRFFRNGVDLLNYAGAIEDLV